jgi:hypothetical protein
MKSATALFIALSLATSALATTPAKESREDPAVPAGQGCDCGPAESAAVQVRDVPKNFLGRPADVRRYGIEINPLRSFLWESEPSFSGGVSLFHLHPKVEVAFPFLYARTRTRTEYWDGRKLPSDSLAPVDFSEFTQDVHVRWFTGGDQKGFYLSGFARGAFLSGIMGRDQGDKAESVGINTGDDRAREGKLGLGMELGWRVFNPRGFYWGASLSMGRYVLGKNAYFRNHSSDNDEEVIVDVELLKFGLAF